MSREGTQDTELNHMFFFNNYQLNDNNNYYYNSFTKIFIILKETNPKVLIKYLASTHPMLYRHLGRVCKEANSCRKAIALSVPCISFAMYQGTCYRATSSHFHLQALTMQTQFIFKLKAMESLGGYLLTHCCLVVVLLVVGPH